jgi:hypothetical protein
MARKQKDSLTPRQSKAIAALVSSGKIGHAAEASGVSRRTLTRWLKEQHFRASYLQARGQLIQEVTAACAANALRAVERLAKEMENGRGTPGTRIRAASELLDFTARLAGMADFETRISELEARIDEASDTA